MLEERRCYQRKISRAQYLTTVSKSLFLWPTYLHLINNLSCIAWNVYCDLTITLLRVFWIFPHISWTTVYFHKDFMSIRWEPMFVSHPPSFAKRNSRRLVALGKSRKSSGLLAVRSVTKIPGRNPRSTVNHTVATRSTGRMAITAVGPEKTGAHASNFKSPSTGPLIIPVARGITELGRSGFALFICRYILDRSSRDIPRSRLRQLRKSFEKRIPSNRTSAWFRVTRFSGRNLLIKLARRLRSRFSNMYVLIVVLIREFSGIMHEKQVHLIILQ